MDLDELEKDYEARQKQKAQSTTQSHPSGSCHSGNYQSSHCGASEGNGILQQFEEWEDYMTWGAGYRPSDFRRW